MNSKPPFLSIPINGAMAMANTIEATTAIRPTETNCFSEAPVLMYFL